MHWSFVPALFALALVFSGAKPAEAQFPGELRLSVVDARTGTGLGGVRVSVLGTGRTGVTGGDGSLHLRGLEPGGIELRFEHLGYEPLNLSLTVRNGRVEPVRAELRPRVLPAEGIDVRVPGLEGITVGRAEIAASGARTAGDLLGDLPGVLVVRRSPGGPQEVRLRGSAADQVLVLLDGVTLNDPVTGEADLSVISADELESVRVVPGAQTARFGAGASAGVVLFRTRGRGTPSQASMQAGSLGARGASLELSRGTADRWVSASTRTRRLAGEFLFRPRDGLGGGLRHRTNADVQEHGLRLGAGGILASGRLGLRVSAGSVERGIPGKSFAPSDSARQAQRGLLASGRWTRESQDGSLEGRLHHRRQAVRHSDPYPPFGLPFDDRTRLVETGVGVHGERRRGGGEWGSLIVGGEFEGVRRGLRSDGFHVHAPEQVTTGQAGVYGEVERAPLPGRPRFRTALRLHRDGVSGEWAAAHALTVEVELAGAHLRLSHRSSFDPPSAGDLFFQEGVGIQPNPELRGERIPRELELGLNGRWRLGPTVSHLHGAVFRGDMRDMIVWAPDFRFVWSPRNVDVARRGAELNGELHHSRSGLRVGGDLALNRTTYRSGGGAPGAQVMYRPRLTGGAIVGWNGRAWQARLQARYTGERFPVPTEANALPGFWTVDLSVGGAMAAGGWTVRPVLRIDRLLDERTPFIHAFPEPGRTFALEVRVRPGGSP